VLPLCTRGARPARLPGALCTSLRPATQIVPCSGGTTGSRTSRPNGDAPRQNNGGYCLVVRRWTLSARGGRQRRDPWGMLRCIPKTCQQASRALAWRVNRFSIVQSEGHVIVGNL